MRPEIDYRALFVATPSPYLVLGTDLVVVDVNDAYCRATGRSCEELVGQHLFTAFPDNPTDSLADGVRNLRASLERVLATGRADTMPVQRYDIPVVHRPGGFEERWWSPINTPVHGPDGQVTSSTGWRTSPISCVPAGSTAAARWPSGRRAWRPNCTSGPVNCNGSTTSCGPRTPGSDRSPSPCRRRCCTPPTWPGTRASRCVTCRRSAR